MRKGCLAAVLTGMLIFSGGSMPACAAAPESGAAGAGLDDAGEKLVLVVDTGEQELTDPEVPLAELTSSKESEKFSWKGFIPGFLTATILETGIWAASKSREEKKKQK